jgi:hypothetical protein
MLIFVRCIALSGAIVILLSHAPAWSGEIGGAAGRCSLSGTPGAACSWTSTKCARPAAPMLYSSSAAELNRSADQLNQYVAELNAYMKCLGDEGQADAKSAVDVIQAGVTKDQNDVTGDFNRLRSQYEADRLRVQTQPGQSR